MQNVFFLTNSKFREEFVKIVSNNSGKKVFTWNNPLDSCYYIKDLSPDFILLDLELIEEFGEQKFKNLLREEHVLGKFQLFGLGENGKSFDFLDDYLELPIKPKSLVDFIDSHISS